MLRNDSHRRLECRWNLLTATEVNGSMAGKWDVQCRDFKVLMRKVIRVFSLQEVVAKNRGGMDDSTNIYGVIQGDTMET